MIICEQLGKISINFLWVLLQDRILVKIKDVKKNNKIRRIMRWIMSGSFHKSVFKTYVDPSFLKRI